MSVFMPHLAPIVVLLFPGTVFVLGISLLVLFYGAARRSAFFAKLGAGAAATIAASYLLLLGGVSLASSEQTLPPDGWKYFASLIAISGTRQRAKRGDTRAGAAANFGAWEIRGAAREDLVRRAHDFRASREWPPHAEPPQGAAGGRYGAEL